MNKSGALGQKKTRNDYIELWRFLACIVVFSSHVSGTIKYGWAFVEMFFILSGYFAISHYYKRQDEITNPATFPLKYTVNKFKRIIPYTAMAVLLQGTLVILQHNFNWKQIFNFVLFYPINIFLLPGTGVMPHGVPISETYSTFYLIEGALWYLSAMVVAMPIMLYLLVYVGKKIYPWLFTFLPLLIYGYIIICDWNINGWHDNYTTFFILDIRALAGLLMGGAVYHLRKWWMKWSFTRITQVLLTIVEVGCMLFIVFMSSFRNVHDALQILVVVLALSLSFSGQTYTSHVQSRLLSFLGKMSLPIYCIHAPIYKAIVALGYPMSVVRNRVLTFIFVFILSVILYYAVEYGGKLCGKLWKKMRHIFIAA